MIAKFTTHLRAVEFCRDPKSRTFCTGILEESPLKAVICATFSNYYCAYPGGDSGVDSFFEEVAISTESSFWQKRGVNAAPSDFPAVHSSHSRGPENRLRRRLASKRSQIILVVDDEDAVRELMAMILEADGYTVLRARHSQEALFFNREFSGPIHLLVTDFCMKPHQNGLELANSVRETRPDIPVLYVSGFVEHNALQTEIESRDISRFLAKPFSPSRLLDCVRLSLGIPA